MKSMAVWKKLNTFAHSFIAKVSPKSGEHPIRQERGVSEYHIGEKAIAQCMVPDKSRGFPHDIGASAEGTFPRPSRIYGYKGN